jgi:tetratricopeptide (TPR) repeat protein
MTKTTGHLVTFRNDRLGGRLISVLNTMRIARDHDLPFRVRWHENDDIAQVFNDPELFFEADFVADHFISAEDWAEERGEAVRLRELDDMTPEGVRAYIAAGGIVLIDGSFGHECLMGEETAAVSQSAAGIWARFPLAPAIREAAAEIRAKVGENALGYHVRRGDLITSHRVMNRPWPQKYVFDEIYFRHLDGATSDGRKPILFSDDPDTIARYRGRYPDLLPATELYDATPFQEGQRDLLELIAMSCCSDIVAPALSGFSSTAATLGGIRHTDVLQALSAEEIEAAHQDMVARLSNATPSGSIETGHVSQSLAHAEPWLIAHDRSAEAERILTRLIDDGLNISFLYPRLAMLRLDLGDPEGALAAHAHVEQREVHYHSDVALADICASLAALELGRPDEAARLARRGFWQASALPQLSAIVSALISLGILDQTNFFPTDDAARTLWLHPASRLSDRPGIRRALGIGKDDTAPQIFSASPLSWDWFPLIRPVPAQQLRRHPHRRQHEAGLERLEETESPGALSLAALYDALIESEADPLGRLREIAQEAPDIPMVHHRLSVAAAKLKDRDAALEGAERAAELAPDAPAFIAWRGITRGQSGDREGERADLERAIHEMGFSLPRLPLRLCAAGRKSGDTDLQARAHDLAVEIAPRDAGSRLGRAMYLAQNGAPEAALRDLEIVLRHDVVPPHATGLYNRLTARRAVAS